MCHRVGSLDSGDEHGKAHGIDLTDSAEASFDFAKGRRICTYQFRDSTAFFTCACVRYNRTELVLPGALSNLRSLIAALQ